MVRMAEPSEARLVGREVPLGSLAALVGPPAAARRRSWSRASSAWARPAWCGTSWRGPTSRSSRGPPCRCSVSHSRTPRSPRPCAAAARAWSGRRSRGHPSSPGCCRATGRPTRAARTRCGRLTAAALPVRARPARAAGRRPPGGARRRGRAVGRPVDPRPAHVPRRQPHRRTGPGRAHAPRRSRPPTTGWSPGWRTSAGSGPSSGSTLQRLDRADTARPRGELRGETASEAVARRRRWRGRPATRCSSSSWP